MLQIQNLNMDSCPLPTLDGFYQDAKTIKISCLAGSLKIVLKRQVLKNV